LWNLIRRLRELTEQGDSMQKQAATTLLPYVQQAWVLAQQYDAVVANPPYMGNKYLNPLLKEHLKKHYKGFEKDLFSASMIRGLEFTKESGQLGFMSPFVWMFISSYEELRTHFIENATLTSLIQLEYSGFDGATVPICTFTLAKAHVQNYTGSYIKLSDFKGHENQAPKTLEAIKNQECGWFYNANPDNFKKIPGSPVAYWASESILSSFDRYPNLESLGLVRQGASTSDNERFLRLWHEVNLSKIGFDLSDLDEANSSGFKWFPYNKGGDYRKWYGNHDFVVNYENDGQELKEFQSTLNQGWTVRLKSREYYFKPSVSWSKISSGLFSSRFFSQGFIFDVAGCCYFPSNSFHEKIFVLFLNSCVASVFLQFLSPTLNFKIEHIKKLPYSGGTSDFVEHLDILFGLSKHDWDSYETSWNFIKNSLIRQKQNTLPVAFEEWQTQNRAAILEMQRLEEENNRLFIEAYGLQDELTPEVPEDQITLTRADQEKDIQRLISYAIGCMMGRYRLDRPGLIYAHAGNVDFERVYYSDTPPSLPLSGEEQTPSPDKGRVGEGFPPDEDGILPLTDQEWFKDDATNRFREFLVAVWGEDTLQQNLEFVAESLTLSNFKPKKGETSLDTVRRYLSNQFYKDHLQTYKKRPIYWLFSSGKQKAFECLVYLHRYNDSTLARMRTEYVTPLLGKYSAYADQLNQQLQDASSSEATRIKKDIQALEKKQTELRQFDDKLKHYADMRIKLDLDDGVKVNYGKFGDLLAEVKAVTGGVGD
ncbi:MAG: hypothetical protein RIR17_1603, partial [Planctomycetota bacterium]